MPAARNLPRDRPPGPPVRPAASRSSARRAPRAPPRRAHSAAGSPAAPPACSCPRAAPGSAGAAAIQRSSWRGRRSARPAARPEACPRRKSPGRRRRPRCPARSARRTAHSAPYPEGAAAQVIHHGQSDTVRQRHHIRQRHLGGEADLFEIGCMHPQQERGFGADSVPKVAQMRAVGGPHLHQLWRRPDAARRGCETRRRFHQLAT